MLTNEEWLELLDYLLKRLIDLGADDVVTSIRTALSTRVEQSVPDDNQLSFLDSSNQPRTEMRLLSSKEAVLKAIEIIEIRLNVFHSIAERIPELLHHSSRIVWRSEDYNDNQDFLLSNLAGGQNIDYEELMIPSETYKVLCNTLQDLKYFLQETKTSSSIAL